MNAIKNFLEGLQPKPEGPTNAIDLLKEDHSRVKQMFEKFLQLEEEQEKAPLLKSIIEELLVHTSVEEELVYPILMDEDRELALESLEEHHVVKLVIEELGKLNASDERTKAKVKVLSELVQKHIQEEENQAFPDLENTDTDHDELGQEIMQRKEQLKSSMAKKPTRTTRKRTTRHKTTTKAKTTGTRGKASTSRTKAKSASASRTKGRARSTSSKKPASSTKKSSSTSKGKSAATTARSKSAVSTNQKRSTRARRRMPTKKAS